LANAQSWRCCWSEAGGGKEQTTADSLIGVIFIGYPLYCDVVLFVIFLLRFSFKGYL